MSDREPISDAELPDGRQEAGARPWKTWPITMFVFLLFFAWGFQAASSELNWALGFEYKLAIIGRATGTAFLPSAISLAVCAIHNIILKKHSRFSRFAGLSRWRNP